LASEGGKSFGLKAGSTITNLQGPSYDTFYITGTSPPFSTPKPVRFINVQTDAALKKVNIPTLTWAMCHDYYNWTGPVKLPSVTQNAHKLAGKLNCIHKYQIFRFIFIFASYSLYISRIGWWICGQW